jgi:transcriptional antiterminator NusG
VGSLDGKKPTPLSSDELKGILQKTGEIKTEKTLRPKQTFSAGEQVKIIEGPFETFTGTIEEVNLEKGRLRVLVGIFGRSTPVEVDFLQVEKI